MTTSVDVSDFVSVTVDVSPLAIPYENFGVPLILGDSTVIDVVERVRTYSDIGDVGTDFGDTAPEYLAAEVFFEQQPQPATCMIGRWASTATKGLARGATLTAEEALLANFTAITSGSFFITIDGVPYAITGLNFSAALNLNGVASLIQAALPSGVDCFWNSAYSRFDIVSSTTGATSSVSAAAAPTAFGYISVPTNPASGDIVDVNGTSVTFETSGATGNEVNLGGTSLLTLAALLTFLNGSSDVNISKMNYVSDGVSKIYAISKVTGTPGNAYTLAKTSTAISVSGAALTGGSGTDISGTLGLTLADGADVVPGIAAESALAAVQAAANASTQWYGATVASAVALQTSDHTAVAAYILASSRTRMYGASIYGGATGGTECLDPTQTSDLASVLKALNNKRVVWMYSSINPYSVMTLFGRAFTVNFSGSDTTITLAYKQAPGIPGENLTETQFATLVAKGGNVNINVNNGATMIWPGQMTNGYFFDEVHGTDWLQNRIQTDLFNLLYQTTTKVPQTDAGNNQLVNSIEGSLAAAVYNGFVAPGQWNAAGFGSLQTGMVLSKGFYVYAPAIATQSQADREARKSVTIQAAAKIAGAIQLPFVVLNINR